MASKADSSDKNGLQALLQRPAGPAAVAAISALVVLVGAIYCSGYEALSTGYDNWPGSLIWAAYALLSWYLLFEWVRWAEHRRGAQLPVLAIAALVAAIGVGSLIAEQIDYRLSGQGPPPILLSLLRRTPGIAVALALIAVSRHFRLVPSPAQSPQEERFSLANPAGIRWIGAADNYLELHFGARVATVRMTMRAAERQLARSGFVRIHRSIIVNRAFVQAIENGGERGGIVRLADGTALQAGKAFAANLRSLA